MESDKNKKMRVLFVSSGNSSYGIVPFIKAQGESLIKEGIDLEYYLARGKGFKGYLKNIKVLKEKVKENNYDVIHAHYGMTGMLCLFTFSRKPIVLSVMGSDAYGSFDIHGKRIFKSYFEMFLTQITLVFASQIIVKSKNIYNLIPYKRKCKIIANGVNFRSFKPNTNKLEINTVLWLANPDDPRKNFELIKNAMNLIDETELKLINPYPIQHSEFSSYLNKASVFVLTSYNEGSPNVVKEAMACNIPVVSTDVGDVKEVISNTKGCYISNFTPQDLAGKIKMDLEFGKRTKGREDIKHLESTVVAREIIKIYMKALKK